MEKGCLAIVLHAHLPFVRHPEWEDALEENWLHEALTETYIPLLLVLDGLLADGVDFRLTISLTPTLASMLADPVLQGRYVKKLDRSLELAAKEVKRNEGQPDFHTLALFYRENLQRIRDAFLNRYDRNPVGAFKRLQETGKVEMMASAATHAYLPLLSVTPNAVRSQIQTGIEFYEHLFGREPKGFWLPECGYFPGVDTLLARHAIRYTILETHGITRADERPRHGVYAPLACPSGLAVFGRDPESSTQVWSATEGYPGDWDYREFYRDIGHDLPLDYIRPYIHPKGIRTDTGFKYFRITGKGNHKEVYSLQQAAKKAEIHAANFMFNRQRQVDYLASVMDRKPIVVAPYDAELFGHWWFEGPRWLDHLIRKIDSEQDTLRLVTPSEYLDESPAHQKATPTSSSWGGRGYNETWLNEKNDWIYGQLHQGAIRMERLAGKYARANGLKLRALKQAARELLLAQASDWAFMISSGSMAEYGEKRTKEHMERLNRLEQDIERGEIDVAWLSRVERQDNIFPKIDYRVFGETPADLERERQALVDIRPSNPA